MAGGGPPTPLFSLPGPVTPGGGARPGGGGRPRRAGRAGALVAIAARTFAGPTIDGEAEGVPSGVEPLVGLEWLTFLSNTATPSELVEFVAVGSEVHNITETTQVDVYVDVGADGVFADDTLDADVLITKLRDGGTGQVCVFVLPSDLIECDAMYFQDYSNYNARAR